MANDILLKIAMAQDGSVNRTFSEISNKAMSFGKDAGKILGSQFSAQASARMNSAIGRNLGKSFASDFSSSLSRAIPTVMTGALSGGLTASSFASIGGSLASSFFSRFFERGAELAREGSSLFTNAINASISSGSLKGIRGNDFQGVARSYANRGIGDLTRRSSLLRDELASSTGDANRTSAIRRELESLSQEKRTIARSYRSGAIERSLREEAYSAAGYSPVWGAGKRQASYLNRVKVGGAFGMGASGAAAAVTAAAAPFAAAFMTSVASSRQWDKVEDKLKNAYALSSDNGKLSFDDYTKKVWTKEVRDASVQYSTPSEEIVMAIGNLQKIMTTDQAVGNAVPLTKVAYLLGKNVNDVTNLLVNAANGMARPRQVFQELGIDITKLKATKGMTEEDIDQSGFKKILEAYNEIAARDDAFKTEDDPIGQLGELWHTWLAQIGQALDGPITSILTDVRNYTEKFLEDYQPRDVAEGIKTLAGVAKGPVQVLVGLVGVIYNAFQLIGTRIQVIAGAIVGVYGYITRDKELKATSLNMMKEGFKNVFENAVDAGKSFTLLGTGVANSVTGGFAGKNRLFGISDDVMSMMNGGTGSRSVYSATKKIVAEETEGEKQRQAAEKQSIAADKSEKILKEQEKLLRDRMAYEKEHAKILMEIAQKNGNRLIRFKANGQGIPAMQYAASSKLGQRIYDLYHPREASYRNHLLTRLSDSEDLRRGVRLASLGR